MSLSTAVRKVNIASSTITELQNVLDVFEISRDEVLFEFAKKKPEATFNIEVPVYPNQNLEDNLRTLLQNQAPHSNIQILPPSDSEELTTVPYSQINKIWQRAGQT